MKDFLAIFVICLVLCYVFFLFAGRFIFNIHAAIALAALVIALLITAFIKQAIKIEELEARIKKLESGE